VGDASGGGSARDPADAVRRRARWRSPLGSDLLVGAVALVVYAPALANGYALDDTPILANPLLHAWHTLPAALTSPWWYLTDHLYRPLTLLCLGVEYLVGGHAPLVPHAVNVLLHAAIAILLRRVFIRFVAPVPALAGALLFAVLPVHAQAVATVVGQAELLSALALVGMLLVVVTTERPPKAGRLGAVVLLAAAALAAKEGGVMAPVLVLAAAWTLPGQRPYATRWATAALAGVCILLAARVTVLGTFAGDSANPVFRGVSIWRQWAIALAMLPRAAAMLTLPVPPAIDYVPTLAEIQHPAWTPIVVGALLLGVALFAFWRHVAHPTATTLAVVIAAALAAPSANLFFASGVVLDARTLYAPSIGTALILGLVLGVLARHAPRATPALFATFGIVAAVMTFREASVWRDDLTFLATMRAREPDDYRAYLHMAELARLAGRPAEEVTDYRAAIARYAAEPEMLTDAATVALQLHDTTTAVRWLRLAVAASPRAARARTRLYGVWCARGDVTAARQLLRDGLRLEPSQRTWAALLEARAGGDGCSAVARSP
jgi:protein O-mannosyl-transferase